MNVQGDHFPAQQAFSPVGDQPHFELEAVRASLDDYLGGVATIHFSTSGSVAWVFPNEGGTPIELRFETDEAPNDTCVILAGFSFRHVVTAWANHREWEIFDCINSLINGTAVEYYDFEARDAVSERSLGVIGLEFVGGRGPEGGGKPESAFTYSVPGWVEQPQRPDSTLPQE